MSLSKKHTMLSCLEIIDLVKHYKFTKIPFYENIKEIIKLTPLDSINKNCTLIDSPTGKNIFYDHSF